MKKIIFFDTTHFDHNSIKNRAIGASEYQYYSLIKKLSLYYDITCYNSRNNNSIIDNILYKPKNDITSDMIDITTPIIIQRFLPNIKESIYDKIKNNKIFIWCHDLINHKNLLLCNFNSEDKTNYNNDDNIFKNDILNNYYNNKNINFIFVSKYSMETFIIFFQNYNITFEDERLNVIYNIIYVFVFNTLPN